MNTNDKNRSQVKITPALLLAAQDKKHPLQSIKDLSLKDAVYLITLIRSAVIVTKENHIEPFSRVPTLVPYDIDFSGLSYSKHRFFYLKLKGSLTVSYRHYTVRISA